MNYLAHLLLSGSDPEWRLGGFLGDFVKGPLASARDGQGQTWPEAVLTGVRLHRHLDARVDSDAQWRDLRLLLGPELRRVSGIVLDIVCDHFLGRYWSAFVDTPLARYEREVVTGLLVQHSRLPLAAQRFLTRIDETRLLCRYAETETLQQVLLRVAQRLPPQSGLAQAWPEVIRHYDSLEAGFLRLMPALLVYAGATRRQWRTP